MSGMRFVDRVRRPAGSATIEQDREHLDYRIRFDRYLDLDDAWADTLPEARNTAAVVLAAALIGRLDRELTQ